MLLGLIVILMAALWTEASLPPEDEEENVLHIGGIFPVAGEGGWQGGQVRGSSTSSSLRSENAKARNVAKRTSIYLTKSQRIFNVCLVSFDLFRV